jgi:hypothetical protein
MVHFLALRQAAGLSRFARGSDAFVADVLTTQVCSEKFTSETTRPSLTANLTAFEEPAFLLVEVTKTPQSIGPGLARHGSAVG